MCSEKTLVNCIAQSFLFIGTICKPFFSDFAGKISPALKNVWLGAWFNNFYAEYNAGIKLWLKYVNKHVYSNFSKRDAVETGGFICFRNEEVPYKDVFLVD